jgi:hypothetical protein
LKCPIESEPTCLIMIPLFKIRGTQHVVRQLTEMQT